MGMSVNKVAPMAAIVSRFKLVLKMYRSAGVVKKTPRPSADGFRYGKEDRSRTGSRRKIASMCR